MAEDLFRKLDQGFAAQQAGNFAEAEQLFSQVLESDANNKHALNLLGMLCVNTHRAQEAVTYIGKALAIDPNDPQAHANIGLAYKDIGKAGLAAEHLAESVRLDSSNPVIFNNLGNVLRLLDRPKKALQAYDAALRLDQNFAECWCNVAAALNEAGEYEPGLKAAAKAMQIDARLPQAYNACGDICVQQARYDDALENFAKAIEVGPDFVPALIGMAKVQRDIDEPDRALETLQRAFELDPDNPQALHIKGVLFEQMGNREKAAEQFRRAIRVAPPLATSHYYLAQIKGRTSSNEERSALQELWANEDATPNNRMYTAFGLYRVHEQRGDFEAAYSYLSAANRIKADARPYDDVDAANYIDGIRDETDKLAACLGLDVGHDDSRPVFVLGMPRSGTSLTEQILASHSRVAGAGELSYAFDTMRRVRDITGKTFPAQLASLTSTQVRDLGEYYVSRHKSEDLSLDKVVDKSPLNFQYVGPLGLMLSGARFVHCHRDPIANCFAIHRIPFDLRQTYAHSLEGLGKYYTRYWELMQYWRTLFPDRILDVRYEDTVADVEGQAKRILDFLGLPFENQVLDFYKTERLVKTPSASQVREPIYKDAVALWKNYEKYLGPLIDNLNVTDATSGSG